LTYELSGKKATDLEGLHTDWGYVTWTVV